MENIKSYSKKHYSQIVRHAIQIVCFFAMPGLFILALNSIGGLYQSIINGTFTFEAMKLNIFVLIALIPVTIIFGRVFCGYMCAFGAMQEFINFIGKKLKIKQINLPKKWEAGLKHIKFAVFYFLIIAWVFKLSFDPLNPWYVFGVYSNIKGWTSISALISFGGAFLFLIIASSLFSDRLFCRYLCPLGGLLTLISIFRVFKVKTTDVGCVHCQQCNKKCPMKIDVVKELEKHGKITSGECINCLKCADVCPKKAINTNVSETVKFTAAAAIVTGVYFAGVISSSSEVQSQNIVIQVPENKLYLDGTYQGTGEGFRGPVKVTVSVDDGLIKSIVVDNFDDDPEFFNRAKGTIITNVISKQTTDVSIVSGATYSSQGLISAIKNALETAKIEIKDSVPDAIGSDDAVVAPGISSAPASSEIDTSINYHYVDGSYTGSGQGFRGTTKLTVNISGGRITSIVINSYQDDQRFFENAKDTMISRIIAAQSTNVQTVSGATYSSRSIISGVNEALSKATEAPASSSEQQQESSSNSSKYVDGSYSGSGQGFRGTTMLTVTISSGKITSIVINSYKDDSKYFNRAKDTMISRIIAAQSTNVQTVSGATYSSRGIIRAVDDALTKAV